MQLTLKDLGDLKRCHCSDSTVISIDNKCSNCRSSAYNDEKLADHIRHLRINDNSKIMVHMLDIMSNLQKRRSDEVVKIIERTFLETYSKNVFEPIKPTFDLIHFIVFNLVEDYDYVKLTQIFIDFLKKSLKVDMNLTEILMLYLFKDNLILSSEKGQIYDFLNTTAIYKRQICTSGAYSKEKKMLVKYLSLSTSFLAAEPQISDDLIEELTSDISALCGQIVKIPTQLIRHMIHFPLYFTQVYNSIEFKIKDHAENSNISPDISELILYFTKIANGAETWKKDFEHFLKKSPTFSTIKKKFDVTIEELFGVIYLMRGDTQNDYFDRIISSILKKSNLGGMKSQVDTLIHLYTSQDKSKINKALLIFKRHCPKEEKNQFLNLCSIFFYLKNLIKRESKKDGHKKLSNQDNSERIRLQISEFYESLPSKKIESDSKLKIMFIDSIFSRNYAKFKTFKENMLFVYKTKASTKMDKDGEMVSLLNIVDFFFEISLGSNYSEMISKLKDYVPEFEVSSLFQLCIKLLKIIKEFKDSTKDMVSDRLKESYNSLAEILIGRPNDFEQLWKLIYSSDHTAKLKALNYFVELKKLAPGVDEVGNDRFKFHAIYIDKRVKFMINQSRFIKEFSEVHKNPAFKFGMIIIKRIFMKNSQVTPSEIDLLLTRIVNQLDPSTKNKNFDNSRSPADDEAGKKPADPPEEGPIESSKLTRFYTSLMDFIVNQEGHRLGNYFLEDHNEPMLRILSYCRYSSNPNEIVNKIFDHLMKQNHIRLCSLLYLYYTIIGLIQRRKIHLKFQLELEISNWLKIKPEFMEFIELYMDREPSSIVDMLFKIQNRIFSNLYSDQEQQKARAILGNILTRDFYQTFDNIISGVHPSLGYLSELFKIPLKKLRFIYTLTSLKLNNNLENVFEQFMNNQDMRKALELQVINPQELGFLLKICLNESDYDSVTDLLRLMKQDQLIKPEILINLLLLDLKIEKKSSPMKDFNKKLLVHSAIFESLDDSKEMCWAFARVLKGDFIIYSELTDFLSKSQPQNHKYFSSILKGFIGVKNYIYSDDRTEKSLLAGGIPHYCNLINSHFTRFRKGDKENTLEYAQYLLHDNQNGFKVHPLWKILVDTFSESKISLKQETDPKKFSQIAFLKDSKENNQASLMNFIVIYNIVNADEAVLEFIHDFAFFKNILRFLNQADLKDKVSKELHRHSSDTKLFFEQLVREYKQIMKKMIKDKKIIFDYEHFAKKNNPIFQGFLMDACKTYTYAQPADFYLHMNTTVFQVWKQDLHRRAEGYDVDKDEKEKIDRLTKKIEELFRDNKMMFDPFTMFVTHENEKTKEYWDRAFEEVDYLDDYLDSLVDYFFVSLEQVNSHFAKYKLINSYEIEDYQSRVTNTGANDEDDDDNSDEEDDDDISTAKEEYNEQRKLKQMMKKEAEERKKDDLQMSVDWFGLPLYVILDRLRSYQPLSSDDKLEKINEIVNKSNILFGILEKALYFYNAGDSFRKFKYLNEFCLSIGIKIPANSWIEFSGSLFMPELKQYNTFLLNSKLMKYDGKAKAFDQDSILSKCFVIKDVYENDRNFFPNRGIFSLFCYEANSSSLFVNDRINLAVSKAELAQIHSFRRLMREPKQSRPHVEPHRHFYVLNFLLNPKVQSERDREEIFETILNEDIILDPSVVSFQLISKGFYDSNKLAFPLSGLIEVYFAKSFSMKNDKDMTSFKRRERDLIDLKDSTVKFLNDVALNRYSVLSETKNIFTEDMELATHQKIYESILHLHSSKRMFDRHALLTSLKTLAPYLSSNIYNLNSILEFVVEPMAANVTRGDGPESLKINFREYHLFREMGLKNHTFFHIFLLHTYPNEIRMQYIRRIIEDLGIIDYVKIKPTLTNLLNLCYLVKSDREAVLSKNEFKELADGILGTNAMLSEEGRATKKRTRGGISEETEEDEVNLVSFIYKRVNLKDTRKGDKHIEKFYSLVSKNSQDHSHSKIDSEYLRFILFNKFVMSVTSKNKKHYLVRFESDFQNLNEVFGVKNWSLMSVFDIINIVTTSRPENLQSNLPNSIQNCQSFFRLLSDSKEAVGVEETFSELLVFICAFYKYDIEGILKFLKSHNMQVEYCFVISYYCYIGVLNGWLQTLDDEDLDDTSKENQAVDSISLCLCYPMIQQLYSSLPIFETANSKQPMSEQFKTKHNTLVQEIFNFESLAFLKGFIVSAFRSDNREDGLEFIRRSSNNIDLMFKGVLFKPFEDKIDAHLSGFMSIVDSSEIRAAIVKLKNLYLFRPDFYLSVGEDRDTRESNATLKRLIHSAYSLRDLWENTKRYFEKSIQELLDINQTNKKGLLNHIREMTSTQNDFSFMNVNEQEKMVLQNYIFTMMVFVFLYLKNVRTAVDSNDNNTKLIIMKQSITFVWKLISNMHGSPNKSEKSTTPNLAIPGYIDPIQELSITHQDDKIKFLNKYTELLYTLKLHRSDILILKELLKFARTYIFSHSDKSSIEDDVIVDKLVNDLKLDSFMELYDYLEELEKGKDISENYKENIVNLFIQIMNQNPLFKKHIEDIRAIVKLIQGDFDKIDYFVEKLFSRSENVSFAHTGELHQEQHQELHQLVEESQPETAAVDRRRLGGRRHHVDTERRPRDAAQTSRRRLRDAVRPLLDPQRQGDKEQHHFFLRSRADLQTTRHQPDRAPVLRVPGSDEIGGLEEVAQRDEAELRLHRRSRVRDPVRVPRRIGHLIRERNPEDLAEESDELFAGDCADLLAGHPRHQQPHDLLLRRRPRGSIPLRVASDR